MEPGPFKLEHLEDRTLFSVAAPLGIAPVLATTRLAPASHAKAASHPLAAPFNVAGTFTHPIGNPDAGAVYDFTGTGRTGALGKFHVTGHVTTPGFVASGRASGKLILTNAHGTITLSLHGPPQGPGSLPPTLTYRVFKGTGAYGSSAGSGKIGVSASGTTHKFLFRFNPPA